MLDTALPTGIKTKELEIWFRGEIAEEVAERLRFDDQSVPYKHCGWGLPSEKNLNIMKSGPIISWKRSEFGKVSISL